MSKKSENIKPMLQEWLDLPYRRDENYLMVVHHSDLPNRRIEFLIELGVDVCVRNCEEFDGDYRRWVASIRDDMTASRSVLFLLNLNVLPEDAQGTIRAFWLNSMKPDAEHRMAFSFTPVNASTSHVTRFNLTMPIFERRARGITIDDD